MSRRRNPGDRGRRSGGLPRSGRTPEKRRQSHTREKSFEHRMMLHRQGPRSLRILQYIAVVPNGIHLIHPLSHFERSKKIIMAGCASGYI